MATHRARGVTHQDDGIPSREVAHNAVGTQSQSQDWALTKRGAKTRKALVRAARTVFERDGFLDARITDIAKVAGVAHGSFYTYFRTKEEIFREVVRSLLANPPEDAVHSSPQHHDSDPLLAIEKANRRYLDAYRQNARIMAIVEEVSTFNDDLRSIRQERMMSFVGRVEASIQNLQDRGIADRELDPHYAAIGLTSMVGRVAYVMYVLGEPLELEPAVWTVTRLWCNALGISTDTQRASDGRHDGAASEGERMKSSPTGQGLSSSEVT